MLNAATQGLHSHTWLEAASALDERGETYVLVTLLATRGSTPRASGTKMVISAYDIYATIGGGHLEYKVIEQARGFIEQGISCQHIENFQLDANLGQCCGGSTAVMFEVFSETALHLDIYGAGHISHALITLLGQLPLRIRLIDSRATLFPATLPNNVLKVVDEEPLQQVSRAPANSAFLILTHSHHLDFELCQAIIKRNDTLWLGVIGSNSKSKKFKHRLAHRGFTSQQIQQMICPIGLAQVQGKLPMEVAISVAGQLIEFYQSLQSDAPTASPIEWSSIKNHLTGNHLGDIERHKVVENVT